jgi:hypothetical protein
MTQASLFVERVVAALGRLAALGETIADEWTYVHDLEVVWAARLRAVAASPTSLSVPEAELQAALDELVAEADRIVDPHRAIDWLSTLPTATLVALGEAAW